uniref:histidine kinase n=1 Tax=Nitratidesulfovibrio vulgaris (strain DSM 19637 / Miyazaki F) TaxID=883 RepID=B8DLB4_NITV9
MDPILSPHVPELFITLTQRFGLLLAGGFAIMTVAPLDKVGPGRSRPLWATALLVAMFGMFGILGTYTGNFVFQSFANLRAMGVITAGLFGGPVVGAGAGIIAAGHRYLIDVGGFSALPCGLATLSEGILAGLVAWRFPERRLDWATALTLGLIGETYHMGLVLWLAEPFTEAVELVRVISLPMILINAMGAALFVQALRLQLHFRDLRDSTQARQILSIANRTLSHLRSGLTRASAQATAEIILDETHVAAVALTGGELVLAHVGAGDDHHMPGFQVRTMATRRVAETGEPLFVRDRDSIGCRQPGCPLTDAIIVPLRKGGQILGCLKLYGTKNRPLDQTRFELAKGLADLFSTQIELEEIGIKNQLIARAEIRRLQAQINPHFLFNSLNAVASFCRTAPGQARDLILDLARYMRRNLDSSRGAIRLSEELEQVRSYLVIEQARFGDRIRADIDLAPGTADWLIPPLLIQPLVENSVRHGILAREEGGLVRLSAHADGDHLLVTVEDDGAGMDDDTRNAILAPDASDLSPHMYVEARNEALYEAQPGQTCSDTMVESLRDGIGARNCNQRLMQMYGPSYAMRIDSEPGRGTRISFRIPRQQLQ